MNEYIPYVLFIFINSYHHQLICIAIDVSSMFINAIISLYKYLSCHKIALPCKGTCATAVTLWTLFGISFDIKSIEIICFGMYLFFGMVGKDKMFLLTMRILKCESYF